VAELRVEAGELVLHLTPFEELEGLHRELRVPTSAVRSVQVLDDAHEPVDHGWKVGTRLPRVAEVGTIESGGRKLFAAVHHDTPRGVRVTFDGSAHDAWIVGCDDPERVAAEISHGLGGPRG
jgi:hypothetical protein